MGVVELLLVVLLVLLIAGGGGAFYRRGDWGPAPIGLILAVLLVVVILLSWRPWGVVVR